MSRRWLLGCLVAGLALPAASHGETPAGFRPIGPPAMLNTVVFAADGTAYGTVESGSQPVKVPGSNAAVWRSTDHGRTWSAAYHAADGAPVALLAASNVSPATVYASVETTKNVYAVERIDVATGKAVPLPFESFLGEDAAGTAYGIATSRPKNSFLVRCAKAADACDALPVPLTVSGAIVVDPNSVGVLSSVTTAPVRRLELSTDAGATWVAGAPLPIDCGCYRQFAGPAPRLLYLLGADLSVSLDAGLSWAAVHPVSQMDAFVVGNKPSATFRIASSKAALFTGDSGASFRSVAFPSTARSLVADPTDVNHLVLASGDEMLQTWDGGVTWSDVADARFGLMMLAPEYTAGAGRRIYAVNASSGGGSYSLWLSDDMGVSWTNLRRPSNERRFQPVVSRDDPRAAFMLTQGTSPTGATVRTELRTGDGGQTWLPVTLPAASGVYAIAPGDAAHVFARGSGAGDDIWESRDGALTWAPLPLHARCAFSVAADATSPTGQRLGCNGWGIFDPRLSLIARPLPYAEGLFGSPDRPGAFAIASQKLLGDVQNDWSWSPLLAPTGIHGPSPPNASGLAAWPAKGGTTFVAYDPNRGMTWVRRATGRWWRLQVSGRDLTFVSLLDSTHALVRDVKTDGSPLAVVDLRRPAVDSPQVQQQPGGVACVVPWGSPDATTSGYAWLRDGVVLRGATRMLRPRSRYDRGRVLTCRATARTAWGSVTLSSSNVYRVAGEPIALPRLTLEDEAHVGTHLHCSARARVTWVRDERTVPRRHGRTYRVGASDLNHAIACQTELVDGTVVRSPAAFVTP